MTGKKVEIVVEEGYHYFKSVKNGAAYTSVDYNASRYGGASPCDNEKEVQRAIKHAKECILEEGDTPIVVDNRECNKLTRWLL